MEVDRVCYIYIYIYIYIFHTQYMCNINILLEYVKRESKSYQATRGVL